MYRKRRLTPTQLAVEFIIAWKNITIQGRNTRQVALLLGFVSRMRIETP